MKPHLSHSGDVIVDGKSVMVLHLMLAGETSHCLVLYRFRESSIKRVPIEVMIFSITCLFPCTMAGADYQ
jgi:hypothetical protein